MSRLRGRLTYSNVVATLALFLALGGTSVAALRIGSTQVRDNSLRSRDIRDNDLRGRDIRDGSLTGRDLRRGSIRAGQVAGLTAGDFANGQLPDPLPRALPRGKTLRGVFAAAMTGGTGEQRGIGRGPFSFQVPLGFDPAVTFVPAEHPQPTAACRGSAASPQAQPGNLCLYEAAKTGTVYLSGVFNPLTGENDSASRFGAVAFVNGESGAGTRGTWAVTAP